MTHAMHMEDTSTTTIRRLNDVLRCHGQGGRTVMARGFAQLPEEELQAALQAIRTFSDFNSNNDPYSEHGCAILASGEHMVTFKIDYYDRDLRFGSPDPADPSVTVRVLTLMLAEEY